ncbi:site-specific integrase [Enterobacter roggenkampii]|uniref:tyrosine-type recombinase/integrase n=1 Tax=Enterobacter roggenkampii TaxID=1812935 RepID=UPI0021C57161|nr:site-specific integrase [Enterobacter roggenkampii]MCU3853440.1 site-specific integrase [Enterobacter roggenkampii]
MATIRQLPSGKWQAQIRVKGSPAKSATRETKEACEQRAREQERETRANVISLMTLHTDYMNDVMKKNGVKRGGYDAVHFKLVVLERFFENPITSITREQVTEYRNMRLESVSGGTVRLEIQLLSRVLRWACDERGIECEDVTAKVKLPDPGKAREKIIEPIELRRIIDNASDKAKPIIELAYETAMRRNELLAITPYMVDFKNRIVRLMDNQTRNGHARKVPLFLRAVEILKEQCEGKDRHTRIFQITPYGITQAFRRSARISGVKEVCFHSLRHTAISNAVERGLSTVQLMTFSGHRTLSMLQRYTHLKAENIALLLD